MSFILALIAVGVAAGQDEDGQISATTRTIVESPCKCTARVANPGSEHPFDVQCTCEVEKPEPGELDQLTVSGTTQLNGLATLGYASFTDNFGKPMASGFYQAKGKKPGRPADSSHEWYHMINARHSNLANNHQFQLASTYSQNDRMFFRKIATGFATLNPEWNEVATRGSNKFQGKQKILTDPKSGNGNQVVLEILQKDTKPATIRTQHPSIRFHHAYRYWHRLEARFSGLHVKTGKTASEKYSPIYASHFRSVSDAKAKTNIRELGGDVLTAIKGLKGYRYELVGENYEGETANTPSVGVLAQDLLMALPEAVHVDGETGQHFVDYNALTATTMHAVGQLAKEFEAENHALKAKVDDLASQVAELKKMIKA